MKVITYIGIGILVIISFVIGPSIVAIFGVCGFVGFIILCGLKSLGVVKIQSESKEKYLIWTSFIIGLIVFLIIGAITNFSFISYFS